MTEGALVYINGNGSFLNHGGEIILRLVVSTVQ